MKNTRLAFLVTSLAITGASCSSTSTPSTGSGGTTVSTSGPSASGGAVTSTGGAGGTIASGGVGGAGAAGGSTNPRDASASGGATGTGGSNGTGGAGAMGGTTNPPDANASAGSTGTGGASATGGTSSGGQGGRASGGATGSGGQTGTGGASTTGGAGGTVRTDASAGSGGSTTPAPTTFDNPIIKYDATDPTNGPGTTIFTADGAALAWNNKVYLYTGHDEATETATGYRMFDFRLWVSSDMVKWENKGAVMRYDVFSWAKGDTSAGNANASQVVQRNDKDGNPKFYFYAPVQGGQSDYGISIGVAVADSPEGPFKDARGIPLVYLADTAKFTATHSWRNLDPTVLVDDDGQVYMYWGNGLLYSVKLEEDMIRLKGETVTVDASGKMQNRNISAVTINAISTMTNYTEAPWLSKRGSLYYLSYASGFPETISYATATSPEGPWQYRGVIVDRVTNSDTIHQSIFDFNGASYITYHNGALPTGGSYRRSTCVDRLYYNDDGTIKKVVQTKK